MSKQKYPQASVSTTSATGTPRKGRASYSQIKTHAKQDRKRREAYARQDKYDSLTLAQQLATTDPNGSKRQRARIEAAMAKAVESASAVKVTPPKAGGKKANKAKVEMPRVAIP